MLKTIIGSEIVPPIKDNAPFAMRNVSIYPKSAIPIGGDCWIQEWNAPNKATCGRSGEFLEHLKNLGTGDLNERLFTTDAQIEQLLAETTAIEPELFIFHCGRCGSTLLARLLELEHQNRVIIEPGILDHILRKWILEDHPSMQSQFTKYIRAMGLGAEGVQNRMIVKLQSLFVFKLEEIRQCFPNAQFWYVFRNPDEVLESMTARPPVWQKKGGLTEIVDLLEKSSDTGKFDQDSAPGFVLAENFKKALSVAPYIDAFIDYRQMPEGLINHIRSWMADETLTSPDYERVIQHHSKSGKTWQPKHPKSASATTSKKHAAHVFYEKLCHFT